MRPKVAAAARKAAPSVAQPSPFSKFFVKPFPVRAVFEVGSGGLATVAVAMVDTNQNAIRQMKYMTQLPLRLHVVPHTSILDDRSIADLGNCIRQLQAAVSSRFKAVNEMVGVLTPPFDQFSNANDIARNLSKEFRVGFSLLPAGESALRRIAFRAYAAAAQSLNMENLIVIVEKPAAIELIGVQSAPSSNDPSAPSSSSFLDLGADQADEMLLCSIPLTTIDAHRLLILDVQKRVEYHIRQSSNPVVRSEFLELRSMLERKIAPYVDDWVHAKSRKGCAFTGASSNGGLLNVASRVCGKTQISLEGLEVQAQFHYCELTEVLIGENYANPHWVVPQAALAAAMMRVLGTARVSYLPEISLAQAILVAPQYWLAQRADAVYDSYSKEDNWVLKQRQFSFPHQVWKKFNPNEPADIGTKFKNAREPREPGCGSY